jgi:hypothetical protein
MLRKVEEYKSDPSTMQTRKQCRREKNKDKGDNNKELEGKNVNRRVEDKPTKEV